MSNPVLALIVLLSTLLWSELALLGEGGFAAFFAHPARIALVIVGVVLAGLGMLSDAGLRTGGAKIAAIAGYLFPCLSSACSRVGCRPGATALNF